MSQCWVFQTLRNEQPTLTDDGVEFTKWGETIARLTPFPSKEDAERTLRRAGYRRGHKYAQFDACGELKGWIWDITGPRGVLKNGWNYYNYVGEMISDAFIIM